MPLITTPKQYVNLHGSEQSAKWDIVKQLIFPDIQDLVLDAGSGPIAWWKEWHTNTITLDPFFRPPGKLRIKGCAERLPLKSKSVDYTVAVSSIHLAMPLEFALEELARVTRRVCVITMLSHSRHAPEFEKKISDYFVKLKSIVHSQDIFYLLEPTVQISYFRHL